MRRLRPAILVLALLLVLAGCDDDDSEDAGGEPTTAPVPTVIEPETEQETETETETEPERETEPETEPTEEVYEIQQGDTLWAIAERFGTSVDAIVEANDIDDPSTIFPGDELVIPRD